jgi:molecular chaperone HtpG
MQEKGTISIHTENIFPIIKKFLYSDHEIFLRELIANAVDATQKIKRLTSLGENTSELGDLSIEVSFDKDKKTITVKDKGLGMTGDEIKKYINQIAFSGATEFVEKFKDAEDAKQIIGKFGLGFYSAFMVADTVEIISKSYQEGTEAARWTCDGNTEFELGPAEKTDRGTEIILHVNKDSEEFLEEYRLKSILDKYCKFMPVDIIFGTEEERLPDGKDEEGKDKFKTEKKPRIINNTAPIWTKAPAELKDEDYLEFYKELYPFSEDPLFWIHLNVDYPFNLTGVLYFPKVKGDLELQRNKIQLYSRQVFITDEVKDVVPEFLMLLHGVIDSPDIPLNVSRSYLQSDSNVKKINSYITKKVADKLEELFKKDRAGFETKWDHIGLFVKYGMISEEKFAEKAQKFTLLKNTEGKYFTLEEYGEKTKVNQTDKNGQNIWLYASDEGKQDGYIRSAGKVGYDVAILDGILDSHFVNHLEQKIEKTSLKRVDADVIDKLIEKDEKRESLLNDKEQESLKEIFTKAIANESAQVSVAALAQDELPVVITQNEFMRRMKDMAKTGGGMNMFGAMPETQQVTLNANHPIMAKIIKEENDELKGQMATQAYDIALLGQDMLKGKRLTEFLLRSVDLLGK